MDKYILLCLLTITLLFTSCQNQDQAVTETPPIISIVEPTSTQEQPTPTEIAATPSLSTPDGNSTTEEPPVITPTMTAIPSLTPIPEALVENLTLSPVIVGAFQKPVFLTHANDERLFVVEQAGVVKIIADGVLQETPFLDIRDRVGSGSLEQGLLSIIFHPNFPNDPRLFIYYTDKQGDTHISSFIVEPESPGYADPDREIKLLSVAQPYANHNGGQLAFGPGGFLFAGFGDGGSANDPLNHGQNPNSLLGTIIRIDVDSSGDGYGIPSTNPFVSDDNRRNEIWGWGLRNPWRFSFDRLTGDLYIADVGQNVWEEVHFQPAQSPGGENYGWNILEGSRCFSQTNCNASGLEQPIFEYDHQGHCSVTGGYVYRGSAFPQLYGNYFVADYCSGNIWALIQEEDGTWTHRSVLDTEFVVSSFGQDVNGELYLLDHNNGSVYQLQP